MKYEFGCGTKRLSLHFLLSVFGSGWRRSLANCEFERLTRKREKEIGLVIISRANMGTCESTLKRRQDRLNHIENATRRNAIKTIADRAESERKPVKMAGNHEERPVSASKQN